MEIRAKSTSRFSDNKFLNSFVSGGFAGIAAKTVIAPMDRIKILFQVTSRTFTYKSAMKEAVLVYRDQGLRGMWRGNMATAARIFPYAAIQFTSFDFFQGVFKNPNHTYLQKNFYNFLAGSLTGFIATAVTYPTEFIRTRMAMEVGKIIPKTMGQTISYIYRKEGIKAFYNGMGVSLAGIVPYHGFGFCMYHLLKADLIESHPHLRQSKAFDFLFGAIAGLLAQLVTYPFDVIRKKAQAQNVLLERGEITEKKGGVKWLRYIYQTEGVRGMYKGITMNVVKGPMSTGTSMMVKNILNRKLDSNYRF